MIEDRPPQMKPYKSGNGALILVLGILSIVSLGFIAGIPAWILGNKALREINQGILDPREQGITQAGRLLGIISTCLSGCGLVVGLSVLLGMLSIFAIGTRAATVPNSSETNWDNGSERRVSILRAATAERKKVPSKTYDKLVSEMEHAKNGRVPWYSGPLKPIEGCGSFNYLGKDGMLVITDACGSDQIVGWPPQN